MAHPGTRASRPHMAWRSLGHRHRWDRTVAGPCLSFGLAHAVHAGRVAACLQRRADAPPPPARNKDAGETPAVPGVIREACKRPLARFLGVVQIRFPVSCVEDAHPGTRASRPHMAWRSLGHRRHWDRTVTEPCLSFGLANAVHAGRVAACRQPCADAPPPPARSKDAGETPAVPGVILEACKQPLARFLGGVHIRFPVCWVDDAHPGTRASRPHIYPAQPWPTPPPGWNGNGALPFIRTGPCRSRRQGGCLPATLR